MKTLLTAIIAALCAIPAYRADAEDILLRCVVHKPNYSLFHDYLERKIVEDWDVSNSKALITSKPSEYDPQSNIVPVIETVDGVGVTQDGIAANITEHFNSIIDDGHKYTYAIYIDRVTGEYKETQTSAAGLLYSWRGSCTKSESNSARKF
jgi:hypothetical protein